MKVLDKIFFQGHPNVSCTHGTTIEITKDKYLTPRGNCIMGIRSSKGCIDLNEELKAAIKSEKKIRVLIQSKHFSDEFIGFGCKDLKLLDPDDMVFRKSDYICDRTVLINCTKSSNDLDRDLIKEIALTKYKLELLFFNE